VGTISGTVVSAVDSRPLPNVTVTLALASGVNVTDDAGAATTVTTDTNGNFTLANEPIASYQMTFSAAGFVSKTVTVGNSVAGPTTLGVTLATSTAATGGTVGAASGSTSSTADAPTFQLSVSSSNGGSDPYAVGFGATVTVNVSALTDTTYPDAGQFTYTWKISTAPTTSNPSGAYFFASTSSSSATFNTMSLAQEKAVEMYPYTSPIDGGPMGYIGRLGVLGINPDETGNYTVSLTVTDPEGHFYTFTQPVRSTWQTSNVADVPVGNPVYLQGDTFAAPNWLEQGNSFWKWPNTSWTWSISSAPPGSTATLADANTQFPHFVPDVTGTYIFSVTQTSSYAVSPDAGPGAGTYGTSTGSVTVYAGTYLGVMNGNSAGCTDVCHAANAATFFTPANGALGPSLQPDGGGGIAPNYFATWTNTSHYSALQRKMDGYVGNHFGESCLQCHTLGWSNVATAQNNSANGGFTFAMTEPGNDGGLWQWPSTLTLPDGGPMVPGAYEAMVNGWPKLAPLAGIQCENCHGPAGPATGIDGAHPGSQALYNARVDWSAQLCASCHEEKNNHFFPSQWGPSGHGNLEVAVQRASVESKYSTYGGGADPQSGAQFCARCHSAQGFVQYARMLSNFPVGRYDFITTDDKKLQSDGGNAPTTAYLASLGLTAASVQSQTCVSCHDPHSNGAYGAAGVNCALGSNNGEPPNTACDQLRIYDTLPGLPSGQGAISGVGAGAICMTCHNGRNGEHTDYAVYGANNPPPPYAETPHDSTATEALFGFNAYFVPQYNPSPHLAIQDTCTGCHVALPTATESAAGQSGNHGFATDLSICSSCHGSTAVNGAAIQSQVATELANLGAMIVAKEQTDIANLDPSAGLDDAGASGGLCVRVSGISNALCTGGSCASSQIPTAIPFPVPPSNVWLPTGIIKSVSFGGPSTTATLNLNANTLSIPYYDPQNIGTQIGTLTNPTKVSVAIYTILAGTGGSSGTTGCGMTPYAQFASNGQVVQGTTYFGYVYLPSTVTAKAIWNYNMLTNEGSGGIHNFPWTTAVLSATEAAIKTANTNGTY
jgi:hypothetical protein